MSEPAPTHSEAHSHAHAHSHPHTHAHTHSHPQRPEPHPQHSDYVNPSPLGYVRGMLREVLVEAEEGNSGAGHREERSERNQPEEDNSRGPKPPTNRTASADDWDNVRDGSISRRPAWRRPSPKWVLPFLIGVTISLGMTMAPRAELYLDLACLAHPPQTAGTVGTVLAAATDVAFGDFSAPMAQAQHNSFTAFASGPISTLPLPNEGAEADPGRPLNPGEKWFRDAQRAFYRGRNATGGGTPEHTTPFPEIDPAQCKSDKVVTAAAARLTMTLTIAAGLLAAMSTGHWAGVSDRIGRTRIASVAEFGMLLNDACFLVIVSYPRIIQYGGIYVLLVGPVIEGLLGGISTHSATMHAYISDVTPDGSRVTAFTRLAAFVLFGFSLGPILGSTLISATGNILTPFYVSVCTHLVFCLLMRFLLPESLSSESRAMLAKRAKAATERRRQREETEIAAEREDAGDSAWSLASISGTPRRRAVGVSRRLARRSIVFLRPLSMFRPRKRSDGRRDWNLALIAAGAFLNSLLMGLMLIKPMYTMYAFGWTWAELGPYMSGMAMCRVVVLVGLMPVIVYYIKPYFTEHAVIEHQSNDPDASPWRATRDASPRAGLSERTPLLSAPGSSRERGRSPSPSLSRSSSCSSRSPSPSSPAKEKRKKRSAQLDLLILRVSMIIEIICLIVLSLNTDRNQRVFVLTSAAITLGAPTGSAVNSLALSFLPHQRETGRLFGGLAILQAVGSSLVAPLLFNNVFAYAALSASGYVEAVFVVAALVLALAFVIFAFLRLPRKDADEERGRGRAVRGEQRGRAE